MNIGAIGKANHENVIQISCKTIIDKINDNIKWILYWLIIQGGWKIWMIQTPPPTYTKSFYTVKSDIFSRPSIYVTALFLAMNILKLDPRERVC